MTTPPVPDAAALDALLRRGHEALRQGWYTRAIDAYEEAKRTFGELADVVDFSLDLARRRAARDSPAQPAAPGVHRRYGAAAAAAGLLDAQQLPAGAEPDSASADRPSAAGPLVSVIMPIEHAPEDLGHSPRAVVGEAVRSVLDQTCPDWELLVCDASDAEDVAEAVHLHPDRRLAHHRLSGAAGATARNHGIARAAGPILAFLAPEDVWHPRHLEEAVRVHRAGPHPVVRSGQWEAALDGEDLVAASLTPEPRAEATLSTVSLHRAVLDEVGVFDPRLDGAQDRELLARCARHWTPVQLDAPLVLRRRPAAGDAVGSAPESGAALDAAAAPSVAPAVAPAIDAALPPRALDDWHPVTEPARTIAIKIAAPSRETAWEWGDYHFARHLADALERLGWRCAVHCRDQWYTHDADINLVLRGRVRFDPDRSRAARNLLWSISHPDRLVGREELDAYDHVFVASSPFAEELDQLTDAPVSVLHQATDPEVFADPEQPAELPEPVAFIGNSRGVRRRLVDWAVEADIDLAVWGTRWERFLPERMVHGDHVPNDELAAHYAGAAIVLNDHWETMAAHGYLSNRLFDASAAGAFVVSDPVAGLEETFGEDIPVVDSPQALRRTVDWFLAHPEERRARAERARERVLAQHTFDHRAWELTLVLRRLAAAQPAQPAQPAESTQSAGRRSSRRTAFAAR